MDDEQPLACPLTELYIAADIAQSIISIFQCANQSHLLNIRCGDVTTDTVQSLFEEIILRAANSDVKEIFQVHVDKDTTLDPDEL